MKKRLINLVLVSLLISLFFCMSVYAGEWKSDKNGWKYQNDDGSYTVNGWQWIPNPQDKGTAQCFYFDENGYNLYDTTTPDGYTLDYSGAWAVDGVIQNKLLEQNVTLTQELDPSTGLIKGTMVGDITGELKYYLYIPKNATDNMPMVVWLHGAGIMKNKQKITDDDCIKYLMNAGKESIPAYVLIPYIDHEDTKLRGSISAIATLINKIASEYCVDQKRISGIGISNSASGLVVLAHTYPEIFSCIVPISASPKEGINLEDKYLKTLSKMPVWYFIEEIGWSQVQHANLLNSAQKLRDAGGTVWTTVLKGRDHHSINIFQNGTNDEFGIFDWIVTVSK